ncbi:SAM-dependent methyltransferase [Amycolatopsis magusensis]|uniref:SAM-dependent methyltransferase n=1 Tax=Amycolatopsis magusensis TaxID=882444 RepID=UPI0037AD1BFA
MTEPRSGGVGRVLSAQFGNGHGTFADRQAITRLHQAWPGLRDALSHENAFQLRVVTAAYNTGIAQFVFLGHDYPTTLGPVFQAACLATSDPAGIVVVESDPESRAAWHAARFPVSVKVSARDRWAAGSVLTDLPARGIDLARPVCLVVGNAATYTASTEHVDAQLARYRAALPPGSWMALSHLTAELTDGSDFAAGASVFRRLIDAVPVSRTRDDVKALFGDWPLLSPGVCPAQQWRPDDAQYARHVHTSPGTWSGVARHSGSAASLPWPPGVLA